MFTSFKVRGVEGQICWGYLPAVVFGPWTYEGHGSTGTLTAQVVSSDEFRLEKQPLVAVVPMGRATWRWSVITLQISGATLTASLARQ